MFTKKSARSTIGQSRDWQTALFNQQINTKISNIILKSFLVDQRITNKDSLYRSQLLTKQKKLNLKSGFYKPKNFCLISGKNRTYNNKTYISRQVLRKLARLNLITGLSK